MMTLGDLAETALRVVQEAPLIAYDTETSGLDWKIHWPVGYVITAPDFNSYIPVRHGGGANLMDPNCMPLKTPDEKGVVPHSFERALAKAFIVRRERKLTTVGHNVKYDMHMSANVGIMMGRECEDTGNNAALLDEFTRSFSLDELAKEAGVTAKKGEELYKRLALLFGGEAKKEQMEHYWRLAGDDPVAVDYAMGDGITTLGLRNWQRPKIAEEGMDAIAEIENRLIWTIFRMERRGIRVDISRVAEVREAVKKMLDAALTALPPGFNVNSGPQAKAVMQAAGITNWEMTAPSKNFPEGQPQINEKFLKKSARGKQILAARKWTNITNKFIDPFVNEHMFNGRIYPTLHQLRGDEYGTISGRFSCAGPNLQAITKRDKELGRLFRSIFVPDADEDFWEADYSQCEPRLFAHYSQEPALLNGYNSIPPLDMHHVVAEAFGVERDPTAKRMNMGILTGMFPESFAGHMDWPLDKATEAWNKWFESFPKVKDFQDKAKGVFKNSGYVMTILKRRCRLDYPRYAYRATSRVIQGSNADIIKYMLLKADEWLESIGDPVKLLMTIHDSFVGTKPKGLSGQKVLDQLVEMWCDVQTAPFNLRVPFVMDVGTGPNWAIATYGPLPPSSGASS